MTGYVTLLAEELDVPPDADHAAIRAGPPAVSGSRAAHRREPKTMRSRWLPIRETGARARQMLAAGGSSAVAGRCGTRSIPMVPAAVIDPRSGMHLAYAELASAAATLPVPDKVAAAGRPISLAMDRQDGAATGYTRTRSPAAPAYGVDTQLPDLLVAVIARPPRLLAQPLRAMMRPLPAHCPVSSMCFPIHTGVAVLGETFWHAQQAAKALTVEWSTGPLAGISSASIRAEQGKRLDAGDAHRVRDDGDTEQALQCRARRSWRRSTGCRTWPTPRWSR